ncbi:fatty acid desaturase [Leptolyngbya boryana CZ1]|uniref:Fatty acid desaturase n=1 Tax=Leptolyngbya boryana CZ1 TaxID=3060204 RepID=A0AA97AQN3_LEPBY|nr:fatty acid desaturase [Leptolyngbya boryana]WNZ47828.1 fatty acid desaturase [Leptolyngbya boryana CZ1]
MAVSPLSGLRSTSPEFIPGWVSNEARELTELMFNYAYLFMVSRTMYLKRDLHSLKLFWNGLAIFYTLSSYSTGIGLLLLPTSWLNIVGVLLLTHSLTLATYLAHEFMHANVFSHLRWNAFGGNVMLWLNGSCYVRFSELMKMHIAHHTDRIDYCRFNLVAFLDSLPSLLRFTFLASEWLYIPSLAFFLRIRLILAPFRQFERRHDLIRVVSIFLIRSALFAVLGAISLKALLLYLVAYISMIHILRLMDAFQHTYESLPVGVPLPQKFQNISREEANIYEQANTFSNIISHQYPWLNLILLNFGYHNAHHADMTCPWYSLPKLDRQLYSDSQSHYLILRSLLRNYHRFRVSRIYSGQGEVLTQHGNLQFDKFYGATEVSFLVVPS